jgi:hypothetical protein
MKDETGQDIILWLLLLVLIFITAWLGTEYLIIKQQNKQWEQRVEQSYLQRINAETIYLTNEIAKMRTIQSNFIADSESIIVFAKYVKLPPYCNADTLVVEINPPKGACIYRSHINWR